MKYKSMFGESNPAKRPEVRAKLSKRRKEKIANGDKDIKIFGSGINPSFKGKDSYWYGKKIYPHMVENLRKMATGRPKSNKERKEISERTKGDKNPNWRGGIQYEPYTEDFNEEFKELIRKRDNYTCQLCGKNQGGYKLDIHHIDYDKNNTKEHNCISLCRKCHTRTTTKRKKWFFILSIILLKNYQTLTLHTRKGKSF